MLQRRRTKQVLVDLLEKSLTEEVKEFQEVNEPGTPQNEKEVRSNLAIVGTSDSFGMSFIRNRHWTK